MSTFRINSVDKLRRVLDSSIREGNLVCLKDIFSKFKSSNDEKFGDYINDGSRGIYPLSIAVCHGNIEVVRLLLKNGANPNIEIDYISSNKIKKLLTEYGRRADRVEIFGLLAFAAMAGITSFSLYPCGTSLLFCTAMVAFALVAVLLVAKAIHDVFYAQTKWPSPDFNVEQVINSQEQDVAGSSQGVLA